jgi:ADP-heptose:LPS heptosyltransferase
MSADAQKDPKIRMLVIQLARLGDTLQSLMALRAAQQLYPQLEITLVVRENFSSAAKRVPWIHQVVTLPTDALLSPVLKGARTEKQSLGDLARWVSPLADAPWDYVVNWSYSQSSSWLAGLLPARVKLGYSRTQSLELSAVDGWSHYLQAIVQGGVPQNIHLTDVLTTQLLTALQIHVGDPVDAGNQPVTSKAFFALEVDPGDSGWGWRDSSRKWIGIQLGAGHPTKTWSPENWGRVARYILKRHPECGIVLLGGKEDLSRARRFMSIVGEDAESSRQVLSLVGKSDFDLWASAVGQCQWILGADTAVIHLASVLGTRSMNVSVGPVRWTETGPYGNGHYVVASALPCKGCEAQDKSIATHECREQLTAEAVYAAWSYASGEWAHRRQIGIEEHFSQLGWNSELANTRVLRSRIRPTEDGGGVVYEPLIRRAMTEKEWIETVTGHVARAWYCGWVPEVGHELARERVSPLLIQSLRRLEESCDVMRKICDEGSRVATELHQKGSKLRSDKVMRIGDRTELKDLGKRILELDKLIERMGATHPALQGVAQMSKVLMHNLKGEHLADLGRESADSYRQLGQGVSILRDWCKHTLTLAKPVALQGSKVIALNPKPLAPGPDA